MPEFEIIDPKELPVSTDYLAPFCKAHGVTSSRGYVPEGFGQFIVHGELGADAELEWDSNHGDEGLFVLEGELDVNGQRVPAKGGVILESGVAAVVRVVKPARTLHMGSTTGGPNVESILGPPDPHGHVVNVYGPEAKAHAEYGDVHAHWFADSNAPTSRIALFRVSGDSEHVGNSHSHSAHELITVTAGMLQVGRDQLTPGMTMAIPGNRRYGFKTTANWEFVNFRLDASYMTRLPSDPPVLETMWGLKEQNSV